MQEKILLRLRPSEAVNDTVIRQQIADHKGVPLDSVTGFYPLKRSMDARSKQIWISLTVQAFIGEPFTKRNIDGIQLKDVSHADKRVIVIGAGPAGLYAALTLIENGIKPIVLERGKDVRERRRDLAILNKEGIVNPESNYCFGEGGAGTYSDGKLYTRSNKRGSIDKALNIFVQFGADENILVDAHPHIGTNKLPQIITAMRQAIRACGGEFLFEKKVVDFRIDSHQNIQSVRTADGDQYEAAAFVLATGHSARDIFQLLHDKNIAIEAKPFALGVRIEHPQELINQIQYCHGRQDLRYDRALPPASYSLVQQVHDRGVFSFCMCPGGIIAPAATAPGELVVNGWSPSKRNNPHANSGMVAQVSVADAWQYFQQNKQQTDFALDEKDPLLLMRFQQAIERNAYAAGGGKFAAPAQRMVDFTQNKISADLPDCSYIPGVTSTDLKKVLPDFISKSLQAGFKAFGQKMKGYLTNEAIVLATESRTSSPVRIPRDAEMLHHPQVKNLFPCAEGAGYAGGIISAAMDGARIARQIAQII